MQDLSKALNIYDLQELARRRMPKGFYEFVARGAEDEVALANNRRVLDEIKLQPRVLVDVSERCQDVTLFGHPQPMPIVISPTGPTGQVWYRGEIELARAAAKAGIPFTLATGATTSLEEVMEQGGDGRKWFQLYMWPDREMSYKTVERAKAAGYQALVVTLDAIISSKREWNLRNGFTLPFKVTPRNAFDAITHPRWLFGTIGRYLMTSGMPRYENYPTEVKAKMTARPIGQSMFKNESLTWDDLSRLREMWPGTLIVKGILHPDDAVLAAERGADGVIISNHGAMILDSAPAPIQVLPDVVAALGGAIPVFVDSGYRRGSDIVKALALGASAVFIGRATLFGVAAAGEAGATRAIDILREEISLTMAAIGTPGVADIGRDHVIVPWPNAETTAHRPPPAMRAAS